MSGAGAGLGEGGAGFGEVGAGLGEGLGEGDAVGAGLGEAADDAPVRSVKSAERTLQILEALGAAREPVSVTDLHQQLGYPRSSLHQLLHTMARHGWIDFMHDGTRVGVGSRALLVGTSYLDRDPALMHAAHALETVRDLTGYTTHYARIEGAHVIYLATRETTDSHRATSRVGRQLPAHATSLGKALLADLSEHEVAATLPTGRLTALTPHTITSRAALQRELNETRARGYSRECEENTIGVSCVGVAVPYRIPATDAISCSIPLARASEAEIVRVSAIMREQAGALARTLREHGIR